jgi:threonine synthase
MSFATGLICRECGATYPSEARTCVTSASAPLEVDYDLEAARGVVTRESIAGVVQLHLALRRAVARPGSKRPSTSAPAGRRFAERTRLAEVLGVRELWLKDDTRNPTGSFKDRVVSVALSSARRLGFTTAACASTGNLATSVAAHAAFIGWPSVTIIPADLEKSKIAMTAIFGGTVLGVEGNYDDVNRLCVELVAEHPDWAFANVNLRPYYAEGSKTLAFEIAEQLGWRTPDQVVVPLASGSQFTKVAKGFKQFIELKLVDGPAPVLFGAQADGLLADRHGLRLGCRRRDPAASQHHRALAGHRQSGRRPVRARRTARQGWRLRFGPDEEILECIGLLAETEGIFAETAGGVTIASLRQMIERGTIDRDKSIVAIISGHGLKTLDAIVDTATVSSTISPSLEAAEEALRFHQLVAAS